MRHVTFFQHVVVGICGNAFHWNWLIIKSEIFAKTMLINAVTFVFYLFAYTRNVYEFK